MHVILAFMEVIRVTFFADLCHRLLFLKPRVKFTAVVLCICVRHRAWLVQGCRGHWGRSVAVEPVLRGQCMYVALGLVLPTTLFGLGTVMAFLSPRGHWATLVLV